MREGVVMPELIFQLLPHKPLQLGRFYQARHAAEVLREHVSVLAGVGKPLKVEQLMRIEDVPDVQKLAVDVH